MVVDRLKEIVTVLLALEARVASHAGVVEHGDNSIRLGRC